MEFQDRFGLLGFPQDHWGTLSGDLLAAQKKEPLLRPAVGDFVGINSERTIEWVAPRASLFSRIGATGKPQPIAANVDVVFVVAACGEEFRQQRIERYLAAIWQSGARPVVLLNKIDTAAKEDLNHYMTKVRQSCQDIEFCLLSATTQQGFESIPLEEGKTYAFVGSSGVGKSTIINRLLGETIQSTSPVGEYDKGRHTTTNRALFSLPGGAFVIDTPGMRQFKLAFGTDGIDKAFPDVKTLARQCKFSDCSHTGEPKCAVTAEAKENTEFQRRLEHYQRLLQEQDELAPHQK